MNCSAYNGRVLKGFVERVFPCGKTASVIVQNRYRHAVYKKVVNKKKKFLVDLFGVSCSAGDELFIQEIPPVSKKKNWRVLGLKK